MIPPLHFGDALEVAVRVLRERHDDGERKEEIDRNEEREERRQIEPDEDVLQRDRDVEGRDERVVVGRFRRRDGDEFAQQEEAQHREEDEQCVLPDREGDREDDD